MSHGDSGMSDDVTRICETVKDNTYVRAGPPPLPPKPRKMQNKSTMSPDQRKSKGKGVSLTQAWPLESLALPSSSKKAANKGAGSAKSKTCSKDKSRSSLLPVDTIRPQILAANEMFEKLRYTSTPTLKVGSKKK